MTLNSYFHLDLQREVSLTDFFKQLEQLNPFFQTRYMDLGHPPNYFLVEDPSPYSYANRVKFYNEDHKEEPPFLILDIILYSPAMNEQTRYVLIEPGTRDTKVYIQEKKAAFMETLTTVFGAKIFFEYDFSADTPAIFAKEI